MIKQALDNVLGKPNSPSHGYVVNGTAKFLPLDVEAIKKELGVEETAVLRGRQNLPKEDADALDEVERAIIAKVEGVRKSTTDDYDAEMKAYSARLSAPTFHSRVAEMAAAARQAESDFETTIQHALMELTQLRDERVRAEADLNAFREQNRLRREASLPGWPWYLSFGFLGLIFAIETGFNGMFFGEKVEGGLAQGFVEAIVFAFINIVCGFGVGRYGATQLIHIRHSVKAFGAFVFLLSLSGVFLVNLIAAHYRSVLVADVDIERAAFIALENLQHSVFGIGDLKSWLLMGFGWVTAIAAAIKGWCWDEPYPGYGKKARVHSSSVDEFIFTKKSQMTKITEDRGNASVTMRSSMKLLEGSVAEFRNVLEMRTKFHNAFTSYLDDLEVAANDMLTAYRQKNAENRTTPAPAHFKTRYALTRPNMLAPSERADDVEEISSLVKDTRDQLQAMDKALHEAHDSAILRLNAIA